MAGPLMRVALVTNFCPHYRRPLFREISQRMDLTLVFTSRGTEWYWHGERPTDTGGLPSVSAPTAKAVFREITSGGYDAVVVGLAGRATLLAVFGAAMLKRLPLVLWVEIWEHPRTLVHRVSRPLARVLYRSADAIVTFGPHVSDFVNRESGRTQRIFVAPPPVDNSLFRRPVAQERVLALRKRLQIEDGPIVTFVGRLEEDKGVSYLLQASAQLDLPHCLVLAGQGNCLTSLEGEADRLDIRDRVRMVGHLGQDELLELLNASDLLVLPSVSNNRSRETWGMVVNEAMNCGLPVVATDAVGAAAGGLLLHGHTGLVVAQRDAAGLATALGDLLKNHSKRRQLGVNASNHVLKWNYSDAADAFLSALTSARKEKSACVS
jgi:glycosyltransferase involved in cell wall biosynthesis